MDSGKFGVQMNAELVVGMIGGVYIFDEIFVSSNRCELSWLVAGMIGRFIGVVMWYL